MPKRCHHCKSEEHLVADCPFKQTQGSGQADTKSSDSGEGASAGPKPDVTWKKKDGAVPEYISF